MREENNKLRTCIDARIKPGKSGKQHIDIYIYTGVYIYIYIYIRNEAINLTS